MKQRLHKNARTTFAIRKEIKNSSLSINALSKEYGLSWKTVKKWKEARTLEDKPSNPKKLNTNLTKLQEYLILFERKQFKKTLDDIFCILEYKIPNLYPMKIFRCLKRYGLNILPQEFVQAERRIKKLGKNKIGYLHIEVLYLPEISKESYSIYTCIDRVSKVAFVWVADKREKENSKTFFEKTLGFYPYKINYILTGNGLEFCHDTLPKDKKTNNTHPFTKLCHENKINHRKIKFGHSWNNGVMECLNSKIEKCVFLNDIFNDLNTKLMEYINNYNFKVRLKSLNHKTPSDYLKTNFNYFVQRIVN